MSYFRIPSKKKRKSGGKASTEQAMGRKEKPKPKEQVTARPPEPVFKTPASVLKPPTSVLKSPRSVLKSSRSVLKSSRSVLKSSRSVLKSPTSVLQPPTPGSVLKQPTFLKPFETPLKAPQPPLKRSRSIVKPPTVLPKKKNKNLASSDVGKKYINWPKPVSYKKSSLMLYGSMNKKKESSEESSSEDDESADVDVVGFTDFTSDEDSDSSEDSDVEDDSKDIKTADVVVKVEVEDDVSVNMVLQPDPLFIQELLAPLALPRQGEDSVETSNYDEHESSDKNVAKEPYDDSYLNEGYVDELDKYDEEFNMMDHVTFPINPSHEIVRIVKSNLVSWTIG